MIIIAESLNDHYPFSVLHCQWELRIGYHRIFERNIKALRENSIRFIGRPSHVSSFYARFPEYKTNNDVLFSVHENGFSPNTVILRADTYFPNDTLECFRRARKESACSMLFTNESGEPIGMILPPTFSVQGVLNSFLSFEEIIEQFLPIIERTIDIEAYVLKNLWDVLDICSKAIVEDEILGGEWSLYQSKPDEGIFVKGRVFIGKNVSIASHCVFDASQGAILISDDVTIMPNVTIIGPCSIGKGSVLKIGAKIYSGTTIGEMCKIGGEIENSVIQGFSNKQHEGFLGHSFISEWVNIGADTNTSDLKNTYGNIDITLRGKKITTNRMFLGSLIGDHSKTAIDTALNTGLAIGIHCQIATVGALRKELPSFSFVTPNGSTIFNNDKAKEIASVVMSRRKKSLVDEEIVLMDKEFNFIKEQNDKTRIS